MNNEKLIELVKEYRILYDITDKMYSDTQKKDRAWEEIGRELHRNGKECKRAWALLRDSFRRITKKRKQSGQALSSTVEKRWKYEDEMSFLVPYLKERPVKFPTTASDEVDYDSASETFVAQELPEVEEASDTFPLALDVHVGQHVYDKVNQYSIDSKMNTPPDDIELFMAGITSTLRSFPPRDRAIAKARIFEIVSCMEIELLSEQTTSEDTFTFTDVKPSRF